MSAAKNPISLLQEILRAKSLPPPEYGFAYDIRGYHTCHGRVDKDISAIATGRGKKQAKRECARKLLELLKTRKEFSYISCLLTPSPTQSKHFATIEPTFNAVGKLNEICSKNALTYPVYTEQHVVGQKFVIECKMYSYTTQGMASSKKRAKQVAAKEMLNRIPSNDLKSICADNCASKQSLELEQGKIIQLFQQLTIKNKERHRNKLEYKNAIAEDCTDLADEPTFDKFDTHNASEEDLRGMLVQMKIVYKIIDIQKSPLMIALRTEPTKNHRSYTFMVTGEGYETTLVKLLKKTVDDLTFLYN